MDSKKVIAAAVASYLALLTFVYFVLGIQIIPVAVIFTAIIWPIVISILAGIAVVVFTLLPVAKVPLSYNLRNLQVRWKTTLVTALAFTMVISLLTVMLAFVRGMYRLTESSGNPGNVMVLSDGATDEAFSNLPGGVSVQLMPRNIQQLILKDEKGSYLAVKEVYVIVNHVLPHPEPGGRKRRFVQLRGISNPPEIAARVHDIELQPGGTWFSESGVRPITWSENGTARSGNAYEVVIGDGIARTFGQDKNQQAIGPGEIIDMGDRKWYVVGVMKATGSAFGSEIWARDTLVGETYGRVNSYSCYVLRTANANDAKTVADEIKKVQVEGHSFNAQTEREYYDRLSQTNQQFLYAVMFVAIVMAVGGVLGVMNTMFAAIAQRTKDIGVMRLLGFTRWQILASFLTESLVVALVGGLLGCAVGYLADGWTASSIVSAGAGGGGKSVVLRLVVDSFTLIMGLVFTLIMGAVGGLIPSLSAMRLKPLESLR
jgi:hypothetical protein